MKIRFRPAVRRRGALAASLLLLLLAAGTARAQTPDQIRQQIEALGLQNMSPDQIRQRLTQLGFDPSILDSYLRGQVQREQLTPSARTAVEALTVTPAENLDQAPLMMGFDPESTRELSYLERETGLRVYGMRTFSRASTQFETPAMGPVPPGYVLGPGDEVVLIMTGDVEQQMVLPVTREGFILIPQAGKVWVNGLTLAELRERLYGVLGRVYSGVGRGPEATTQFEATLGRPRANQVFVTGEVRYPGSVFTSAMASVLNALYKAGGPLPTGSFRDVRVLRNGELVERVDLTVADWVLVCVRGRLATPTTAASSWCRRLVGTNVWLVVAAVAPLIEAGHHGPTRSGVAVSRSRAGLCAARASSRRSSAESVRA